MTDCPAVRWIELGLRERGVGGLSWRTLNPSYAKATFMQITRKQKIRKHEPCHVGVVAYSYEILLSNLLTY